jgi:nicotinamidase-related amidase
MDDAAFFASRGFGKPVGFGKRPALVNVDFQVAFTDPDVAVGANADAQVAATLRLIAAARDARIPIFYTAARFDEPNCRDAGVWGIKSGPGLAALAAGTATVEIDRRFDVRPDEHMIWKKRASGFFNTDLASRLTFERVDSVIVTGLTTSGCVRATAIDAVNHNFITTVVREAVGDRAEAPHRQALFDLQQKYCDIVSLEDALSHLAAVREGELQPA